MHPALKITNTWRTTPHDQFVGACDGLDDTGKRRPAKLGKMTVAATRATATEERLRTKMNAARTHCTNLNHRRTNPPVRYCPNCGKLMNGDIDVTKCPDGKHAERRKARNAYCMDCGDQLTT
jgi:hypothetical protein